MRPERIHFDPPEASFFVHEFVNQRWPGSRWLRSLTTAKIHIAYAIDELELPYDDRARLVHLFANLTDLHLMEAGIKRMVVVATLLSYCIFLWDLPWLLSDSILGPNTNGWLLVVFSGLLTLAMLEGLHAVYTFSVRLAIGWPQLQSNILHDIAARYEHRRPLLYQDLQYLLRLDPQPTATFSAPLVTIIPGFTLPPKPTTATKS